MQVVYLKGAIFCFQLPFLCFGWSVKLICPVPIVTSSMSVEITCVGTLQGTFNKGVTLQTLLFHYSEV